MKNENIDLVNIRKEIFEYMRFAQDFGVVFPERKDDKEYRTRYLKKAMHTYKFFFSDRSIFNTVTNRMKLVMMRHLPFFLKKIILTILTL